MSQRRQTIVAILAAGLLAALCLISLGPLQVFELRTLDLRFRLRELRRSPEPRREVRSVALDVLGPMATARDLEQLYARALDSLTVHGATAVAVRSLPNEVAADAANEQPDAVLLEALRRAQGTVMGVSPPEPQPSATAVRIAPVAEDRVYPWPLDRASRSEPALVLEASPTMPLARAARRVGHEVLEVDADGVLRSVPLVVVRGDQVYPSLVLQLACQQLGVAPRDVQVRLGDAVVLLRAGAVLRRIPVDSEGRMLIDFRRRPEAPRGPRGRFAAASSGVRLPEGVQGHAVVLGATARPLAEFYPTTLVPSASDLEILSEAAETILAGTFIQHLGWRLQLLLDWVFLFAGVLLMLRWTPWPGVLTGLGLMALYLVLEKAAFVWGNLWLDCMRPLFAMQAAVLVFPLYNYWDRSRTLLAEMGALRRFDDLILVSMTSGLVVTDGEGHVLKHNPRAAVLLGFPGEALEGRRVQELFAASPIAIEFLERALVLPDEREHGPACSLPLQAPVTYPAPGGERDAILHLSLNLMDPALLHSRAHRRWPCYVLTFSDVTEQVMLAQEDERRARLAAIGEIAAKLGHEIRNSLGGLRLYVENVREEIRPDSPGRLAIDSMVDEIESLYRKIDELREYARDPRLDLAEVDLKQLLEEALAFSRRQLQSKQIQVTLECESRMPALQVDRRQMREAFQNLINNAIEAAPFEGNLRISAERVASSNGSGSTGSYRVEIEDDGPGIAPEIGDQVFSLFFTTKPDVGTGLGLPIVKKIVESHGGKVAFRSEPGRGAQFTITLPPVRRNGEG